MPIKMATIRKKKHDGVKPLGAIVESSDDAIIGRDRHGIVTIWNTGAERLYGYTRAEVIGHSDSMLAPIDKPDDISRFIDRLRRGEPVNHCETVRVANARDAAALLLRTQGRSKDAALRIFRSRWVGLPASTSIALAMKSKPLSSSGVSGAFATMFHLCSGKCALVYAELLRDP
jgi:PAS domain S-box-containing protein